MDVGGSRRKSNSEVGRVQPPPPHMGTQTTYLESLTRTLSLVLGEPKQHDKDTEAAMSLSQVPSSWPPEPSELAQPSSPSVPASGLWALCSPGRGLLLAWGCLPSLTPPSAPHGWVGSLGWLRPLWPQCEGWRGDCVGVFKNKLTAGKPTEPGQAGRGEVVRGEKEEEWPGLGFSEPSTGGIFS